MAKVEKKRRQNTWWEWEKGVGVVFLFFYITSSHARHQRKNYHVVSSSFLTKYSFFYPLFTSWTLLLLSQICDFDRKQYRYLNRNDTSPPRLSNKKQSLSWCVIRPSISSDNPALAVAKPPHLGFLSSNNYYNKIRLTAFKHWSWHPIENWHCRSTKNFTVLSAKDHYVYSPFTEDNPTPKKKERSSKVSTFSSQLQEELSTISTIRS